MQSKNINSSLKKKVFYQRRQNQKRGGFKDSTYAPSPLIGMIKPTPVPASSIVNLSYSYIGVPLDTLTDDFNYVRFKLNSINDPGLSLTSNSVYDYLNHVAAYGTFIVEGSSINVQVVNTDNDVPIRLSVTPTMENPNRVAAWVQDSALVNGNWSKYKMIGNATGNDKVTISSSVDVGKLSGAGRLGPSSYEYTGTTSGSSSGTTDPQTLGSWVIGAQAIVSSTDNINLVLSVVLVYRVRFFNYLNPYWNGPTAQNDSFPKDRVARDEYYASYTCPNVKQKRESSLGKEKSLPLTKRK